MRELLAAGIMSLLATMSGIDVSEHHHHSGHDISINTEDDEEVTRCDQISVRFDHERAIRDQEELRVDSLRALKIVSEDHGGIRVTGWDQPRYAVTACKAAALAGDLRDVRVSVNGEEISASGPSSDNWVVFYLVHAPRNATLDLSTRNGPIGVHDVSGTITAHAQNGPVAVTNSNGTLDVSTTNGPIAYSGSSGTVKLNAVNGPLAVKLTGSHWDGSLDGRTENGPVALKLPRAFGSSVVVTSEGHGPIACKSDLCRAARRAMLDSMDDDEDRGKPRTMTFGSGAGNVSLTTVNGPIAVKDTED